MTCKDNRDMCLWWIQTMESTYLLTSFSVRSEIHFLDSQQTTERRPNQAVKMIPSKQYGQSLFYSASNAKRHMRLLSFCSYTASTPKRYMRVSSNAWSVSKALPLFSDNPWLIPCPSYMNTPPVVGLLNMGTVFLLLSYFENGQVPENTVAVGDGDDDYWCRSNTEDYQRFH